MTVPINPIPTTATKEPPTPSLYRLSSACCQYRHRCLDGNPEAIAWALDSLASSTIFAGSGAFLITALLKLAKDAAGCELESLECNNTIYGMKPASLVSTLATVIGLSAAIMMPVVGAMVDTTPHRLRIGRILATMFCLCVFPTIFVSQETWFATSFMFAFLGFIGWLETMVLYAYLPELTADEDVMNRYTRFFTVSSFAVMVLYLALVIAISAGTGNLLSDTSSLEDEIFTARVAQSLSFCLGLVCFSISWGICFKKRPQNRTLGPNESVWTSGFAQLYRTSLKVHREYPTLQWFFVAIALCDAGTHAIMILAITFSTNQLGFSGADNGAVILIMLIASIPGGYFSSWWTSRFNPVSSSMMAVTLLIINTALVGALLKGPEQAFGAYILAIGWGVGAGWKWTVDRLLYAMILPPNQHAEFSGIFIFFRQCLTWLPPLVFTILTENDVSLRWGMVSLDIVFILGLLVYYFGVGVGNYADAVRAATNNATEETRLANVFDVEQPIQEPVDETRQANDLDNVGQPIQEPVDETKEKS
jgi:UMF1 family MFS transporter